MNRHRPPGFQLPRVVVRPWMFAGAVLLWVGITTFAVAREVPAIGWGPCIGFVVVLAWAGGKLQGEELVLTNQNADPSPPMAAVRTIDAEEAPSLEVVGPPTAPLRSVPGRPRPTVPIHPASRHAGAQRVDV